LYWLLLWGEAECGELVLDGEIVSGSFNKTSGDIRRKDEAALDAEYHVFEALSYRAFSGESGTDNLCFPYKFRRKFTEFILTHASSNSSIKIVERRDASSLEEVQAIYEDFRNRGLEGAMIKSLDGIYAKKRSHAWLKMKNEDSEDLRVIGAFEGTGKYAGKLGGLIVDRKGVEIRVGGGFSDEQRESFWKQFLSEKIDSKDSLLLSRLIEVEYHEITKDGSLRHPRFIRFRDDKDNLNN
jgi:ATP-dependent DNA ligase